MDEVLSAPADDRVTALADYRGAGGGHDEFRDAHGNVRAHWSQLSSAFGALGLPELRRRHDEIARLLEQDGVTYNVDIGERLNRPWSLDAVPLILPAAEWRSVEAGVRQRAELLDLIQRDLYGSRRLLSTRLIPPEMILTDPQFSRECDGITIPGPRQLVVGAVDLVRGPDGAWSCLGHRTQAPSGAAFALENRRVISRVFPVLQRASDVARLAPYVRALRSALRSAAPEGVDDPSIVVLSPGARSETAFEHASIAALLGLPLVQGADLEARDGRIWLRTVDDVAPVHVILRRVDAWFCDPLELRPDSTLGVAGLVDACRAGTVSVVNTLGSGVLENAGLATVLPQLAEHLLGESLLLSSPDTWWCGDRAGRSHVIANLGQLVVRPLSRLGLEHSVDTSRLGHDALEALRRRIEHRPHQWVGQAIVEPATTPTMTPDGLEPRGTVLRTFAVAGRDDYVVMTGGLARAHGLDPTAPISGRGRAISKDTWVLADAAESEDEFWMVEPTQTVVAGPDVLAARAAENFFWLGRYVERADATARLLRVVVDRRDEFRSATPGPGPAAVAALLEATTRITGTYPGFVGDDAPALLDDPADELRSLVADDRRAGSMAHAVTHLLDAIDELRDQLSIDTSLALAPLQRELERLASVQEDETDARSEDLEEVVTALLAELVAGVLAFSGLVDISMVRDQGWYYLDAGRSIERALQVTALVGSVLAAERTPAVDSLLLESALVAGESIITYRRRYRSRARPTAVLELLLTDERNPRSVAFQLPRALAALEVIHGQRRPTAASAAMDAIRHGQAALANLDLEAIASTDQRGKRVELASLATELREQLHLASRSIEAAAFVRQPPQQRMVVPAESSRHPLRRGPGTDGGTP